MSAIVDKNSRTPLYLQLMNILIDMIENNLEENEQILSEREICEIYNVSRTTVRQAMDELEKEGYIYKLHGKGTFVSYKKQQYRFQKLKGFTEVMSERGFNINNKILEFEIGTQNKIIRENLSIKNEHELIYKIKRLRIIDNEPFALETVYIPETKCAGLKEVLKEEDSLYRVFREEYNHKIEKAIQTIEPITLNKESSKLLNRDINSLALKFARKVYTKDQSILEYTISIFTSDKHQYQIRK